MITVPKAHSDVTPKPIQIAYEPRNGFQHRLREVWPAAKVIFATGGAGTGKTGGAMGEALLDVFVRDKGVTKILIGRSPVPKGRSLGFDPGSLDEKLESWTENFNDSIEGFSTASVAKLKSTIIRVDPGRIQGRTIRNAILIIDEGADLEFEAIKNICTRVGHNGKVVICGDPSQPPLLRRPGENPFVRMMRYQENTPGVAIVHADLEADQLRSPFIVAFVKACDEGEHLDRIDDRYE